MATMKDSPVQLQRITPSTPANAGCGHPPDGWSICVQWVERIDGERDAELVRRILARWLARQFVAKSGGGTA
jgi:hypothetical protein